MGYNKLLKNPNKLMLGLVFYSSFLRRMAYFKYNHFYLMRYIFIILLLISCKSTKQTVDNKLDIHHTKTDQTTKVIKIDKSDFNLDEITIVSADPKLETIITDNKGNTRTIRNAKTITIKKQKESKETHLEDVKNDIKDVLIDKSKIKEKKESISDMNNLKWIAISLAVIFICIVVFKLS